MTDSQWAMLATHWDEYELVDFPRIGQPKLEGFRAKWDGEKLTSRQGKVWSPNALPHLYAKLTKWSDKYPRVVLDGEIYKHGMPFQEIEKRAAVKRTSAHRDADGLDFHAFDIISSDDGESRLATLSQIYAPWVPVCRVESQPEALKWMRRMREAGFEGLMLRRPGCGYIPGKSDALIKLKELQYASVTVRSCFEGKGKFAGKLGGFNVELNGVKFAVGGGVITELERELIWHKRAEWTGRRVTIMFRDYFTSGIPVQPQIAKIRL